MPFTPPSVQDFMRTVFASRAIAYFKQVADGATKQLPGVFKSFGALQAFSVPMGKEVTATLLPPAGPRAAGNRLRVQLAVEATTDVVVFEL